MHMACLSSVGIYNMLGKSAAIIGPLLMGGVALLTENHRYSILSLLLLFIVGAFLLSKVENVKYSSTLSESKE